MISNPNLKNSLDSTLSVMFQSLLSFQINMFWSRLVCNSGKSQVIERIFWAVSHTRRLVLAANCLCLEKPDSTHWGFLVSIIYPYYRNKFIYSHEEGAWVQLIFLSVGLCFREVTLSFFMNITNKNNFGVPKIQETLSFVVADN